MPAQDEQAYFKRREEEELVLALAATTSTARNIHYALAERYRLKIEARANLVDQQSQHIKPENSNRFLDGTSGDSEWLAGSEDIIMVDTPEHPVPIDVPLTVEVVKDEVVVDGALPVTVALTKDAALETGIELVNAALGINPDDEKSKRERRPHR